MSKLAKSAVLGMVAYAVGVASRSIRPAHVLGLLARGNTASSPFELNLGNWKMIALRAARSAVADRVPTIAASVAFFSLLSLVPALSVLASIYGLFTTPATLAAQLALFTDLLPEAVRTLVGEQASRLTSQPASDLSFTLLLSLAIAAWSANAAVKALFEALNIMYGLRETRSLLKLNAVSLALTFASVLAALVVITTMAVIPSLLAIVSLSSAAERALSIVRWPILYFTGLFAILMLYRIGPDRPAPRLVWIVPGALLGSIVWAAASGLFSYYVASLGSYPATYGSLATVVVILTWLWISAMVVLAGAEINAEMENEYVRRGALPRRS